MDKKLWDCLLEQGYLPYDQDVTAEEIEGYELIELDDAWLRDLLFGRNYLCGYGDNDAVRFYRYHGPYQISLQDMLELLESLQGESITADKINSKFEVIGCSYLNHDLFAPSVVEKENGKDDPFFHDPQSLIRFALLWTKKFPIRKTDKKLADLIVFLKEMSSTGGYDPQSHYSNSTLSILVANISRIYESNGMPTAIERFYKEHLLQLANDGDYRAIAMIGYEYYEGTNGFEANPHLALQYLSEAFAMESEPDIARTLGYIYYYGRTNNGIPEGDKAFQYFAIGHIAGGYYEATYKLADCYIKGYGTPICHEAAFNLVSSIYSSTLSHYLEGENMAKFADVALRLGSYYRDGIFVEKNLSLAYQYYLEARAAIHSRLVAGEYIGDRGVAIGISASIKELESQLNIEPIRVVKDGGYIIPQIDEHYHGYQFELERIDERHLKIIIHGKENESMLFLEPSIGLCERTPTITLVLEGNYNDEIMDHLIAMKPTSLDCGASNYVLFTNDDEETDWLLNAIDEAIYYPTSILCLEQRYLLVSVEFYPGSKVYEYLSTNIDVKVGDMVKVEVRGEEKQVRVLSVRYCYEDQLPLPLAKMGTVS